MPGSANDRRVSTSAGDDLPSRSVEEMLERTVSATIKVEELNELTTHDKPVVVRAAIARTPYPGVAERVSHDPHPLVRALALEGWDLSDASRARLEADEDVQRLLRTIQSDN